MSARAARAIYLLCFRVNFASNVKKGHYLTIWVSNFAESNFLGANWTTYTKSWHSENYLGENYTILSTCWRHSFRPARHSKNARIQDQGLIFSYFIKARVRAVPARDHDPSFHALHFVFPRGLRSPNPFVPKSFLDPLFVSSLSKVRRFPTKDADHRKAPLPPEFATNLLRDPKES